MSNKNSVEIAYQNANDLIDKKDYTEASLQLEEILKVFPNELNSIYLLINCYIKLDNPVRLLSLHKLIKIVHKIINIINVYVYFASVK